jgi:DNA-binding NarL/FixJ family response regulator
MDNGLGHFVPDPMPKRRQTESARVVVIDSAAIFRRLLSDLLKRRGFAVVGEAGSAGAGLECVARLQPQAAVIDVHLPDQSGFGLALQLTQDYPGLAVLLTSADFDSAFYAAAQDSGAEGFIPKSELGTADLNRLLSRLVPQQPLAQALGHHLRARAHAQLGHAVARMASHGVVRKLQLLGDLGPAEAQGDQPNHLELAAGEG